MQTKLRWIIVLAFIFFATCTKERNAYMSHGIISGQDFRMCACCGGWLIVIDNQQYQFNNLPANVNINLSNEKFPLAVKLDWELNTSGCQNTITVLRIVKE
ncbi:MAG: hypothetical protein WCP08_00890 [Prolixibacteraceae bacterium]